MSSDTNMSKAEVVRSIPSKGTRTKVSLLAAPLLQLANFCSEECVPHKERCLEGLATGSGRAVCVQKLCGFRAG
jgi:hypothetical protein